MRRALSCLQSSRINQVTWPSPVARCKDNEKLNDKGDMNIKQLGSGVIVTMVAYAV